jgi:hypothetical protein
MRFIYDIASGDAPHEMQVAAAKLILGTFARTKKVNMRSPDAAAIVWRINSQLAHTDEKLRVDVAAVGQAVDELGIPRYRGADGFNCITRVAVVLPKRRAAAVLLGPDRDAEIVAVARHESAHMMAALACSHFARPYGVEIALSTKRLGEGVAKVPSECVPADENAFTTVVGYIWELTRGGRLLCAAYDLLDALPGLVRYPHVWPAALAFVERHEKDIVRMADDVLRKLPANGKMPFHKLDPILDRYPVEPFTRPPGGLDVSEKRLAQTSGPAWDAAALEFVRQKIGSPCWHPDSGICDACAAGEPEHCWVHLPEEHAAETEDDRMTEQHSFAEFVSESRG